MIIKLKNKETLEIDLFRFKCSIGKNGFTQKKIEGDKKTPKGIFSIGKLYYRKDRVAKFETELKTVQIKKEMGWCNDINSKYYNQPINIKTKTNHEKLYRKDYKYDLLIPVKYNIQPTIKNKGSAIFIHLTKNYKKTAGCVALSKKDFLILLKIVKPKAKIKIF